MHKGTGGFTLLELLTTIAVAAILGYLAIPASHKLINTIRGDIAVGDLTLTMKNARLEAISRNRVVKVCASPDGLSCSRDNRWELGWITYLDVSGSDSRTIDDPILQTASKLSGISIRKNGTGRTVKFKSDGTNGQNFSFSICAVEESRPLQRVVVTSAGRIRVTPKCLNCSPNP